MFHAEGAQVIFGVTAKGHVDIVSLLLGNGADLTLADAHGRNALQTAYEANSKPCIAIQPAAGKAGNSKPASHAPSPAAFFRQTKPAPLDCSWTSILGKGGQSRFVNRLGFGPFCRQGPEQNLVEVIFALQRSVQIDDIDVVD